MPTGLDTDATTADREKALRQLSRIVTLSQGQFVLVLACCNSPSLRQHLVKRLQDNSPVPIETLCLPPSSQTLYTTLQSKLQGKQPQALMVLGLDSVVDLDRVLKSANFVRNEFSKHCPWPTILWLTDETRLKLSRLAPDLKNWAASPIRFVLPEIATEAVKKIKN